MDHPSSVLLGLEAVRGLYEYGLAWALHIPLNYLSPKGDGHPVLIIPGLGGADGSTHYMRNFLDGLGYESFPWGQGRNLGWSLGGIYGREIAKLCPDVVRQVITLGTPFKSISEGTRATKLYEFLSKDKSHKDPDVIVQIEVAPPVPFTSIYSKTDGVVHWECSIEDVGPQRENIEIPGASHLGLGHNPISMFVVADRLTQTREKWEPYYNK